MASARLTRAALRFLAGESCTRPSSRGLLPLAQPLAEADDGSCVIGSLEWPLGEPAALVQMRRGAHSVLPLGTPAHVARRAAVEADIAGGDEAQELVSFFSAAAVETGGLAYERGAFAQSKLSVDQFLLLRVGPFADAWDRLARERVSKGEVTAGLIAAERGSARNPNWGCCLWSQASILHGLGRLDEARDIAISALEMPFWTIGAPIPHVQSVAQLGHVSDIRALLREVEAKGSEKRGLPPPTALERARNRAFDRLDAVVSSQSDWDEIRPMLAADLLDAGLTSLAKVVSSGGLEG